MLLNVINQVGKPEPPELPDCKGEKLSDLSEYQKLANIQYQRDVNGVWISGKLLSRGTEWSMNQTYSHYSLIYSLLAFCLPTEYSNTKNDFKVCTVH